MKILYKALYPSIIEQNNVAPNTMRGKIILPEQIDPRENRYNNETFSRATWFVEDLISGDIIDFCVRYLNLPGYEEMYKLIIEYFRTVKNPAGALMYYNSLTDRYYLYNTIIPEQKRTMYTLVDNTVGRNMMLITERMPEPHD